MGNCCGKQERITDDNNEQQLEPRLVTLDDEHVDAPELPSTGPPRIIPIEEVQQAKKEFLKTKKTFIMSIIDRNKSKKPSKPQSFEELSDSEDEDEANADDEEDNPYRVQLQVESSSDEESEKSIYETNESSTESFDSPATSQKPKESPLVVKKESPAKLTPVVSVALEDEGSPIVTKKQETPIKSPETPKIKESPIVAKVKEPTKESPVVSKVKEVTKESPAVVKKKEVTKEAEKKVKESPKDSPAAKKKDQPSISKKDALSTSKSKDIAKDSPATKKRSSVDKTTETPEPQKKVQTSVCGVVVAYYPYYGRTERELSFSPGEEIAVVQKIDPWWRGKSLVTNEYGWFPSNFVKPVDKQVSIEVVPEVTENYTYDTRQKEESHIIKLSRKIAPGIAALKKALQNTTTAAMWKD